MDPCWIKESTLSNGSEYNVFQFTIWWKFKQIPGKIKNLINVFSKKSLSQKKTQYGVITWQSIIFEWTTPFRFIHVYILHLSHSRDSWESWLTHVMCWTEKAQHSDRGQIYMFTVQISLQERPHLSRGGEKVKIGDQTPATTKVTYW